MGMVKPPPTMNVSASLPQPSIAIALDRVSKSFNGTKAVNALSLAIPRGSVVALLGGNGAGKSTTIGMIMGLILPSSGTVTVLGADMARERHKVLHRMNFESPYVDMPHRLTVRENLTVFAKLYGVARPKAAIEELVESLALGDFFDRASGKLSAGQKTRVALAKALINKPELLLLDEPTASLDPDTADWIRSRLETYRTQQGATILLASHNMGEVERLCDRVIFLQRGEVLEDATPASLLERFGRDSLETVFLDVVRGHDRSSQTAKAVP